MVRSTRRSLATRAFSTASSVGSLPDDNVASRTSDGSTARNRRGSIRSKPRGGSFAAPTSASLARGGPSAPPPGPRRVDARKFVPRPHPTRGGEYDKENNVNGGDDGVNTPEKKKTDPVLFSSPMPYWRAVEEREGGPDKMSPRTTRSASKKCNAAANSAYDDDDDDDDDDDTYGAFLQISPPNEAENARRDKQKELERMSKIMKKRDAGMSMNFSPNKKEGGAKKKQRRATRDPEGENGIALKFGLDLSPDCARTDSSQQRQTQPLPPPPQQQQPQLDQAALNKNIATNIAMAVRTEFAEYNDANGSKSKLYLAEAEVDCLRSKIANLKSDALQREEREREEEDRRRENAERLVRERAEADTEHRREVADLETRLGSAESDLDDSERRLAESEHFAEGAGSEASAFRERIAEVEGQLVVSDESRERESAGYKEDFRVRLEEAESRLLDGVRARAEESDRLRAEAAEERTALVASLQRALDDENGGSDNADVAAFESVGGGGETLLRAAAGDLRAERDAALERTERLATDLRGAEARLAGYACSPGRTAAAAEDLRARIDEAERLTDEAERRADEEARSAAESDRRANDAERCAKDEAKAVVAELTDRLRVMEEEAVSNVRELDAAVTDMSALQEEADAAALRADIAEDKSAALGTDLKNAHGEITSKADEIQVVRANVNALKSALLECKLAKTESDETIRSLEEMAAKAALDADDARRVRDDLRESAEELEHVKRRLGAAEERADFLEEELQRVKARAAGASEREDHLKQEISVMKDIRRGLHNRVMQLSGNIRVFVRVRPALALEVSAIEAAGQRQQQKKPAAGNKRKSIAPSSSRRESRIVSRGDQPSGDVCPFHFPGLTDRDVAAATSSSSPSSTDSNSSLSSADDLTKHVIEVNEPFKDRGGLSNRTKKWQYGFDGVFSQDKGQEEVWEGTEPLVQSAIDGFPVCMFAYGQTGSGKTHTMIGDSENPGIIPRAVNKIFSAKNEIEKSSGGAVSAKISVEMLEIYNNEVRDLLAPKSGPEGKGIKLRLHSNEAVGNVLVTASCEKDVTRVLDLAQERRCVKATKSNAESSRSHLIFTIHFEVKSNSGRPGASRSGCLHIVDLAGSERVSKSGSHGAMLKEAQAINSSLSVLSIVMEKLQRKSQHIPYRDSHLTYLLRNSLGGDSKTLAIVCCNPLSEHFIESHNSIKFAATCTQVKLKEAGSFTA